MGVASRTNTQHNANQKAKARKSGPSFLRKAQLLDPVQSIPTTPISMLDAPPPQRGVPSSSSLSEANTADQAAASSMHASQKPAQQTSGSGGATKTDIGHTGVDEPLTEEFGQPKTSFMEELMDWVNDTQIGGGNMDSGQQTLSQAEPLLCDPGSQKLTDLPLKTAQTPSRVWRLGAEKLLRSIDTMLGVTSRKSSHVASD
ncbi:hypothetical protein NW762_014813 [Fusarium torreyae]|uniref:Uncharacterized protein n=1 Tax=Fusarium torreyae TaxID=1237075 RepID=A0A9W8RI14_9HYPO|nr:hypothetical protein NW762_014813 [Fusarium torreyae]